MFIANITPDANERSMVPSMLPTSFQKACKSAVAMFSTANPGNARSAKPCSTPKPCGGAVIKSADSSNGTLQLRKSVLNSVFISAKRALNAAIKRLGGSHVRGNVRYY